MLYILMAIIGVHYQNFCSSPSSVINNIGVRVGYSGSLKLQAL